MIIKIKNEYCDRQINLNNVDFQDQIFNGLIDSHGHIMWQGMKNLGLDLQDCKSSNEVYNKCIEHNYQNSKNWIIGRGWNNEIWNSNDQLSIKELDKRFNQKPVFLKRVDGHSAIINSKALEMAGINADTINPDGGKILKDDAGKPNGFLIDNALDLIEDIIPTHSQDELQEFILSGIDLLASFGINHTCDMDVHLEWLDIFIKLATENKLKIQVDQYYRGFDNKWIELGLKPIKINNLSIKGLKFFADGAIGSRGARLIDDYSDDPGNKGLLLISEKELYLKAKQACNVGFEVSTHAIGDAANRMVLDVYEKLRNDGFNNILRIEHAQIVNPIDLPRFKELNIEAHIQPIHCISDDKMAEKRLGERVNHSYPWKSLIEDGVNVYGGSDYPIESCDPLLGLKSLLSPKIKWQEKEIPAIKDAFKIYLKY
ncbi:amidohydrolase [Candidatus Kapabacteria bacterium]|nr:amidohydrolase [Candidatus Kapabacteria bacterium]